MKKKLGIIFGGNSVEHEISIITAVQAMENMDTEKYDIFPIYITKEGKFFMNEEFLNIEVFKKMEEIPSKFAEVELTKFDGELVVQEKKKKLFKSSIITKIDMLMPIVHGTNVEDGTLQGYIETLDVPYAGPTVISGAVGQDKAVMKDVLKANDIDQVDYVWVTRAKSNQEITTLVEEKLGYPVILKPAALGSSIGICTASNAQELMNGLDSAFEFSNKIVIEKMLGDFTEVNISVLGDYKTQRVSVIEQVHKNDEILSYEDKYMSGSKGKNNSSSEGMASLPRLIPAPLNEELTAEIQKVAINTFQILNCQGVIRLDLMLADGHIYVNEVNNIPGSLAFYLWEATDMKYSELLDEVINIGINSYFEKSKTTFSISSNVLNMQGIKGSKGSK